MSISLDGLACRCGRPPFAIKPGCDAEYAVARDEEGIADERLPPILIRREVPDVVRCLSCLPKRRAMLAEDGV